MPLLTFQTARLTLAPYDDEGRKRFVSLVQDPEVMQFVDGAMGAAEARRLMERVRGGGDATVRAWMVREMGDGSYAGHLFIIRREPDALPELGYIIRPEREGLGFATEVVRGLCELLAAGHEHGLEATVDEPNLASRRVLEKCGFTFVGRELGSGEQHAELRYRRMFERPPP